MTESEYKELFKELRARSPIAAEALRYAYVTGLRLLPLTVRGKMPLAALVPNGFKDASNDPEQILDWWTQEPDANIGFVPGLNGLLGIDVDGPAGRESLRKLEAELGVLPATWQVRTGREEQGDHYYFRVPAMYDIKNLNGWHEGIDLKFKGGYLILPPSVHASGNRYKFIGGPFTRGNKVAPLPRAWAEVLPLQSTSVAVRRNPAKQDRAAVDKTTSPLERARRLVREAWSGMLGRTFPLAFSFAEVKELASGKWVRLLKYLYPGFTPSAPNGTKYGTCPVCGKSGKFRCFDDFNETGTCICYKCHEKAGDGITTLAWLLDCEPNEARELLSDLLQTGLMK